MKRVLHLIDNSNLAMGGAQRILHQLMQGLCTYRHSVLTQRLPGRRCSGLFSVCYSIYMVLIRRPSVVFIHSRLFLPAAPLFRLCRIPTLFICHSCFPNRHFMMRLFCPRWVIAVSGTVKQYLRRCRISSRIFIVHNAVGDPGPGDVIGAGGRLAFVGSLRPEKGILEIIPMLEKYGEKKNVSTYLDIVGDGPEKKKIRNLLLSCRHVEGPVHGYQKHPYDCIGKARILLVPSRYEGFGLVIIEGLLAKKAIVCSDLDVFREIASLDDENRLSYFTPGDKTSFFEAMDKAIMRSTDNEWLERNRVYALKFFGEKRMLNGYRAAMKEMGI